MDSIVIGAMITGHSVLMNMDTFESSMGIVNITIESDIISDEDLALIMKYSKEGKAKITFSDSSLENNEWGDKEGSL